MTKEDWKAAKAAVEAIEQERAALLEPTQARYDAAVGRLEEIEDASPERVGTCECGEPIWQGERYAYDSINGMHFCEPCAPSYSDMLAEPENFYGADEEYYTPEQAKAVVDAHLAAGGSLEDKMVSA